MARFFLILLTPFFLFAAVTPGIEILLSTEHQDLLKGKRVALLTNQTGVARDLTPSIDLLIDRAQELGYKVVSFFAPEHGLTGAQHASEEVLHSRYRGFPVHSLHGDTRRPTDPMLKGVDVVIVDIQDIGSRSYTYLSTVCYMIEEAAKRKITVIVADRPNPINGVVIDGPMLEMRWRSFLGYVNVPYCHGMTMGELAFYFNTEERVGCTLHVIPMRGWKRSMTFEETGLPWVPTSPNIPEPTSTYFYPLTGILGEMQLVSIGIGYTLPFKVVGAPWLSGDKLAKEMTKQNLPGVMFKPFCFKPFSGKFSGESCTGILIFVTDPLTFRPVTTQYALIGLLKSLYPAEFEKLTLKKETLAKVNGTEMMTKALEGAAFPTWPLREVAGREVKKFGELRKRYLLY